MLSKENNLAGNHHLLVGDAKLLGCQVLGLCFTRRNWLKMKSILWKAKPRGRDGEILHDVMWSIWVCLCLNGDLS